ncbi:hypothetical protein H310_03324 [Aphanomyces invadans]|uniref:HSF-type DNA-binding domain-containing protein n=1 Tax=Aphanomyces invadans TaxID=157072 RepID=A0A024UHA6_9STRA|nr:hypothetical protein H310_03324 [Aphanomyces invadans]ETW05580.1 hypothetical protein H310_03324 [Aphanomyces invadans]|eukprot:XP_008865357.1 hypothetical protein H310_03324 [Aphanomyces invadans]
MQSAKANQPRFLSTLAQMLANEDTAVTWAENGTCIHFHSMHYFSQHVLPRYFRHKQWSSFQRQLNYYGFRKKPIRDNIPSGGCVYWHPHFVEHKPELLHLVTAKRRPHRIPPMQVAVVPSVKIMACPGHVSPQGLHCTARAERNASLDSYLPFSPALEPNHAGMLDDLSVESNSLAWLDDLFALPPSAVAYSRVL